MIVPHKKEFYSESRTHIGNNPLQPDFHFKMLSQIKAYHENAKNNPKFSLLSSLEIISKFCVTDSWLNTVISEEIEFLRQNNVKNPYHR